MTAAPGLATLLEEFELSTGWEVACAPAGTVDDPRGLEWLPAVVPGTAAAALRAAGLWHPGDDRDFDSEDWWWRLTFDADRLRTGERVVLALDGIATVARVYLNGEPLVASESMFASHAIDVTERLRPTNELAIRCLALAPLLRVSRRPRARWRTRLVSERNLRFFRTMLIGRAPGFAPGPAAVGPWKPVRLERWRGVAVEDLRLRARLDAGHGKLAVSGRIQGAGVDPVTIEVAGPTGIHTAALDCQGSTVSGELTVPGVAPWWPHTHGTPSLYDARLRFEAGDLPLGRVGFRSLRAVGDLEREGLALEVNGVPVFARGAVWTPVDPTVPCSPRERLRPIVEAAVQAGFNMLRIPGTACYEGDAFYDACDDLGVLVWQDFMFANFDYPEHDRGFLDTVEREARQLLRRIGGRPCLGVMCGGSEVAQQAAMMGVDPRLAGGRLYEELLPAVIARAEIDAPYVPSTPWGGELPFRPSRGVANYYGVGAYLRPLEDARRAEVKFAAECLAFSNVPDEAALGDLPGVGHHPSWKAGVPRDVGAGWDFEDVRDHYLRLLFGVDPVALRGFDSERYLDLSRAVTGEVMSETLGEWRRAESPCAGALVLWLKDLRAGAGWGLLDHRGAPKVAYHHVRRVLAPVAVWSTDEGLGGVVAHVANDSAQAIDATLRVAMYRDLEVRVEEVERELELEPHTVQAHDVEALLARFVDASWAYRFGPPAQDLIVLTLEQRAGGESTVLSQAFRFPAGRPVGRESATSLGLSVRIADVDRTGAVAIVSSTRLAYGVRLHVPGFVPADDAFSIEPGHARAIQLRRSGDGDGAGGYVSALNLAGRVAIEVGGSARDD